jgi:hypothetical protein
MLTLNRFAGVNSPLAPLHCLAMAFVGIFVCYNAFVTYYAAPIMCIELVPTIIAYAVGNKVGLKKIESKLVKNASITGDQGLAINFVAVEGNCMDSPRELMVKDTSMTGVQRTIKFARV